MPDGLDGFGSLFAYQGAARRLVVDLKYRNARTIVRVVAPPLAELARTAVLDGPPIDAVTWAPTSAARRRGRGYDQARLLAEAVARELRLPSRRLLDRRGAAPQTGQTRQQRLDGPTFVPRARVPASVLLIDDVRTSGATLSAAARALRRRGAIWIIAVCLAQTPLNQPAQQAENAN